MELNIKLIYHEDTQGWTYAIPQIEEQSSAEDFYANVVDALDDALWRLEELQFELGEDGLIEKISGAEG